MNRLEQSFSDVATRGGGALLPYITAGYPDCDSTVAILQGIDPAHCACVELGIPFSDPIADGPVIQTSFSRALERGFRLDELLRSLTAAAGQIRVPLVAMVSYSIVFRRGPERLIRQLQSAGVDALIVPDLALEEAAEVSALARELGAGLVLIAAPTTMDHGTGALGQRPSRIAALSHPFVYYQCVAGVTGERSALPADLAEQVRRLRAAAGKPVCVGFGIAGPEQVRAVCRVAEGAIVGSAIVRRLNAAVDAGLRGSRIADEIVPFIAELGQAAVSARSAPAPGTRAP